MLDSCIGNVVGKPDRRGNLYPTKARPEQRIDAAVALIMAVGRSMVEPEQFTSIFEWAELRPVWDDELGLAMITTAKRPATRSRSPTPFTNDQRPLIGGEQDGSAAA